MSCSLACPHKVISMANKKYVKGSNFERWFIKKHSKNYLGVRAAGSKKLADVVLIPKKTKSKIQHTKTIVCQLKCHKGSRPKPSTAFKQLNLPNVKKWWVTKKDRAPPIIEVVP